MREKERGGEIYTFRERDQERLNKMKVGQEKRTQRRSNSYTLYMLDSRSIESQNFDDQRQESKTEKTSRTSAHCPSQPDNLNSR